MSTVTEIDADALFSGEVVTCCFVNNNATQISEGIDLEFTGQVTPRWQLSASYTYNRSRYQGSGAGGTDGTPLNTQVPSQMTKIWSSYQFAGNPYLDKLKIGGGLKAQTKSYVSGDASFDSNTTIPFQFTQGFYADVSAFASYQLDKNWSVGLNANNIFDRRYYQTVGSTLGNNWYAAPRNFTATLSGKF